MNDTMTDTINNTIPKTMSDTNGVMHNEASYLPPFIKFCGLNTPEDAAAITALLMDSTLSTDTLRYAGLVFYPNSKRFVTDDQARALRDLLTIAHENIHKHDTQASHNTSSVQPLETVGVFVDEPIEHIVALAQAEIISVAQLHGSEDESYLATLRAQVPDLALWKAFIVPDSKEHPQDFKRTLKSLERSSADLVLVDAGMGSGKRVNQAVLDQITRPFILAGGLSEEVLLQSSTATTLRNNPYLVGVDVSSGIETTPSATPMTATTPMAATAPTKQSASARTTREGPSPQKDLARMRGFIKAHAQIFTLTDQATSQSTNQLIDQPTKKKGATMADQPVEEPMNGRFGIYGGQYIPETLMNAVLELEEAYNFYKDDPTFKAELKDLLNNYANRPSLLYYAERMTKDLGGAKIYLKREDLNHTGAHKINNVLGQALLAKKMGKTRLIAETGAGQHGVATATAAALLDMECDVYMGKEDTDRQALNVYKMKLLGARVHPVTSGTATLKDAVSETLREWTNRIADTHYCLGSTMGPHPFPIIVRDFQSVISEEIKDQCMAIEGRLPDVVMACVGGGSNAMGTFYNFIDDPEVRLIGCEAAGRGIDTFETAATISTGSVGIFHGMRSYFCQDKYGQIAPVYSISAGLDYPGVGPEHAYLYDTGRAEYVAITDDEAVEAFEYLSRLEGIIPAIESSHALAHAMKIAPTMDKDQIIVVTLSGRGDKDCAAIARYRGEDIHE